MKKCIRCHIDKDDSCFGSLSRSSDGFHYLCKDCTKIEVRITSLAKGCGVGPHGDKREIVDGKILCFNCKELKPLKEFRKNDRTTNGVYYNCKKCYRIIYEQERIKIGYPIRNTRLVVNGLLKCNVCKEMLTIDKFPKRQQTPTGFDYRCISCTKKYFKVRQVKDQENRLKRIYSLTLKDYDNMLVSQNGLCALCGTPAIESSHRRLQVDHDHETGKVRGLLCGNCNAFIGMADDSIEKLLNGVEYLKKHKSISNNIIYNNNNTIMDNVNV